MPRMRGTVLGLTARATLLALCAIGISAMTPTTPAFAQASQQIDIPAGTLASALRMLAEQTGINVGGTERGLNRVRTPAIRGAMSVDTALVRLLNGTPYAARRTGPRTYRIERRARSRPAISQPPPPSPASPITRRAAPQAPSHPIVVTASKRDTDFEDYAGGVTILQLNNALPSTQAGSLENLLSSLPITSSTNLGSGRNKLFIRGVADSSFNGPTQSTIGLYYGELRLIYSAPNPDLRLYDVERIELLEGPQGTLYGAGALGGVIRIAPHRAAPGEWEAGGWASGALTDGGENDYDLAGLVNVPLGDRIAVRVTRYTGRLGGYIDDIERGLDDVNRTEIDGWRATVRAEIAEGWTIDLDGLQQMLDTLDGQYIDAGLDGLQRRSAIDQPFDSDINAAGLTLSGDIAGHPLISATGMVQSDLDTRFDASILSNTGETLAFEEERRIDLISHETRLSSIPDAALSWVIGGSVVHNIDRRFQFLGDPDDPAPRAEVLNETTEFALFGEATIPLSDRISATAGGRFVYSESFAEALLADGSEIEPKVGTTRFLPTVALSWQPDDAVTLYARYQRGYRAGGLSIDGVDTTTPTVSRFTPDSLQTFELGARGNIAAPLPIDFSIAGFFTDWNAIQADLISDRGFALTRNIGEAQIYGVTADISITPVAPLRLSGALFANRTHFTAAEDFVPGEEEQLPNVAELGARASAELILPIAEGTTLELVSAIDYTGESFLGVDPMLERPQGNFFEVNAAVALRGEQWTVALEATNLTNVRGNSFSFGNPFTLQNDNQLTPLRPRRLRVTGRLRF